MNQRLRLAGLATTIALVAGAALVACATGDASDGDGAVNPGPSGGDAGDGRGRARDAAPSAPGADDASTDGAPFGANDAAIGPADDGGDAAATPDAALDAGADAAAPALDAGVDASDAASDDGGGACPASAIALVNEVQTDGADGADEFVELANPNDCRFVLTGWTLRYGAASGSGSTVRWTGGAGDSIPKRGYVVIGGTSFTAAKAIGSLGGGSTGLLSKSGGGVGLHAPSGNRVDAVAWGSAVSGHPEGEGRVAVAPASGASIGRDAVSSDTDDNWTDFAAAATPTPGARN